MPCEIPLTQGQVAIVDEIDFAQLNQHKWYYMRGKACRRRCAGNKAIHEFLHQRILPDEGGMAAMHKNGNKLDNRRCNLVLAPKKRRQQRRKTISKSGFRGVTHYRGRYVAQICIGGRTMHIGRFDTAEAAAMAYDQFAVRFYGEAAQLNFAEGEP